MTNYIVTNTSGEPIATINERETDKSSTSLTLFGRGYVQWGQTLNNNLVSILENSANVTPPTPALSGQLWYDTAHSTLKLNESGTWFAVATQAWMIAQLPALASTEYLTTTQTITVSGDVSGSGSGADGITLTLDSVGTPGTYTSVNTDAKGRVTGGTFVAAPPGVWLNTHYFTTPGTFTYIPTTGTTKIRVTTQAAGSASSGTVATGAGQYSQGMPGAAGAWAQKTLLISTGGVSGATVTVGAGGTSTVGGNGSAGGSSSFGSFVSVNGGQISTPGTAQTGGTTYVLGSAAVGTVGVSGDLNASGQQGFPALTVGGASINGQSGSGWAPGYGSGGYGINNGASSAARAGVAGQGGIVIVEEFA